MPIYEFYCGDCHTLFNFFSPRVDTDSRPLCPRCETTRLERRPARFATISRSTGEADGDEDGVLGRLDDDAVAAAMESLASEMEGAAGDDPRTVARLFRRFGEAAGLEAGPRLADALARMEAGEDLDALEDEMDDAIADGDDDDAVAELFRLKERAGALAKTRRPRLDEELYFL